MRRTLFSLAIYGPILAYLVAFATGCGGVLAEDPCDTAMDPWECRMTREHPITDPGDWHEQAIDSRVEC